MPLISLITLTSNSAGSITRTLDSIESQTFRDFEYIVVDAASVDETLSAVRAHSLGVDQLISEPDDGLYDGLNKGIRMATGDVIGFLHPDDVFASENTLQTIAGCFHADAKACYGNLEYVHRRGSEYHVYRRWRAGEFSRRKLRYGWMPPHPTFYLRRALYESYGTYDASYRIAGDYEVLLRYLWCHELEPTYIPEVLVRMTLGGVSNRSLYNILRKTREDIRALKSNNIPWLPAIVGKHLRKIEQFL